MRKQELSGYPNAVDIFFVGTEMHVSFDDGQTGVVSLDEILKLPAFSRLNDRTYRSRVYVERGIIRWPKGEDFDPWWVHEQALGYSVMREDELNATVQGENMHAISLFYGIVISMFSRESDRHHTPHLHARYAEHEAVFSIPDGELIEGSLPAKKQLLVAAWIEIHKEDLSNNWELSRNGMPPLPINPLR